MNNEKNIDYTLFSKLQNMTKTLNEHYKTSNINPDSQELSFEFIVGSLFPNIFNNITKQLSDEHTKGYIEGFNTKIEKDKDVYPITMSGMYKDYETIYNLLIQIKYALWNCGYGLNDAGFHGWGEESLKQLWDNYNIFDKEIDILIYYCQYMLNMELNPKAWEEYRDKKEKENLKKIAGKENND
jgi:hypothetical protein